MSKSKSGLNKRQKKYVKKLIDESINEEIEDKAYVYTAEDQQLYHNKPSYHQKFLGDIEQGIGDGDQSTTGGTGISKIRIGDSIKLKNINIRLWLSNKWDRPNCMYKGVLFWYPVLGSLSDTMVYSTQSNKMLDRYNRKEIKIIDSFIVQSTTNFSNAEVGKKEHSYLATFNKSYKNKTITYDNNGVIPKGYELGFSLVAYDAFGTLQTDNIASFAYQSLITFQDA